MPYILKNKNLEIHIDGPHENYNFSRFDWTGKIVNLKFQGHQLSNTEQENGGNGNYLGKGLYNEFGIDTALGFDEANIGGWFHKIGVGALKKDTTQYHFSKKYEIEPATFHMNAKPNGLSISCKSKSINGYSYELLKEITLLQSGFSIRYYLQNTGEKDIVTDEYNHNFIAMNKAFIGTNYLLKLPFPLNYELFNEAVNPEHMVDIGQYHIQFHGSPQEQFFFSNLSGNDSVKAAWELIHHGHKIGISEIGSFRTRKVNLWGWKQVISPELFFAISIKPGESTEWSRNYRVFNTT